MKDIAPVAYNLSEERQWNDAVVYGTRTPAMEEVLKLRYTFLLGKMYGQYDKRNTQAGDWKSHTLTLQEWIEGYPASGDASAFGFTRHPVGKIKAGPSIVLGASVDGERKAKAMTTMYAMGLDIDSGAALDEVIDKVEALSLLALIYTTHSHGKNGLELKRDEVLRKLDKDGPLTAADVRAFLRRHSKDRYEDDWIEAIKIEDERRQTKDGIKVVLDTPPLDKFRIIFPLAEPVEIIDLAERHDDSLRVWEDKITGLARNTLGVHFDTSCTDPSRLFYTARHPKDAEEWGCFVIEGDPLKFEDVTSLSKASYTRQRGMGAGNAFTQAGGNDDGRHALTFPSGVTGPELWRCTRERLQLADLIEAHAPDRIRVAGGESAGTVHTECPFEHLHSEEGGTACMAMNAEANETGKFTWFCHHDSCQGVGKLEFIARAIADGWFAESDLTDENHLLMLSDEDLEDEVGIETLAELRNRALVNEGLPPEALLGGTQDGPDDGTVIDGIDAPHVGTGDATPSSPSQQAAQRFTPETATDDKLTKFLQKQLRTRIDITERERVTDALVASTKLGKRVIGKLWRAAEKLEAERAKKTDPKPEKGVVVNCDDFSAQLDYGKSIIFDQNKSQDSPIIFNSNDFLARVRCNSTTGTAEIDDLTDRALATFLTKYGQFSRTKGDDTTVGVACPREVTEHILEEWEKDGYPPLSGLIAAPQYSADGDLIAASGYHSASGLYYAPPRGFEVGKVPTTPSAEEVADAVDLWRGLLADFPFEGAADFAHVVGFALESIVRDLMGSSAIAPALLISKPSAGTGATLLLQLVQIILFGSTDIKPPSTNEDELRKEVFAGLIAGAPVMAWDNVEEVGGSVYPALMTAPMFSGRVLGQSKNKIVRNRLSIAFTGNNPTFTKELRRRVVLCRLDARMERPELRPAESFGIKNIKEHATANRGQYYRALLVLVQNWLAKGQPMSAAAPSLASYESWASVIGGILATAGIDGFLANRDKVEEYTSGEADDDPVRELIECWLDAAKDNGNPRVNRLGVFCKSNCGTSGPLGLIDVAKANEIALPVKLARHSEDAFDYNPVAFGRFVAKATGRVFEIDGEKWCVVKGDKTKDGVPWSLDRA